MPLTILTEKDVIALLNTLNKDDILEFHKSLADALHTYSTGTESETKGCCATNQPPRTVMKRQDGSTALFMPASSDNALGVKTLVVSESGSNNTPLTDLKNLSLSDSDRSESFSSVSSSRTPPSSSASSILADSSSKSVRSSVSTANEVEPKKLADDIREPLGMLEPSPTSPRGSITLFSPSGEPRALINAQTLTAFRTALVSTMLIKLRHHVHTLTIFGAGLQAYWHIYITLLLTAGGLHHINIINRDFTRAQRLLMTMGQCGNSNITDQLLDQKLRPAILTPEYGEYTRLLKEYVRGADVIYCCTPSTTPLFPASYLTSSEARRKGRYIAAIGSYKPHMQELHEDILRQAVMGPTEDNTKHSNHPHIHIGHSHAHEGGAIIVDTIEGAMKEAGDIIKAGISGQGVVELGELVMLKRSHWKEKAEREERERQQRERENKKKHSHGGHGIGHLFHHFHHEENSQKHPPEMMDGGLKQWLERGNVIYKSCGLGLMDVVVGMEIVRLAEERRIGSVIEDF